METNNKQYISALRYRWLTKFYDPIIATTTREKVFKEKLIKQAGIKKGFEIIDIGSGTGTLTLWLKKDEPKAEIIGLDGDPEIIEIAQRKSRDYDVKFEQALSYKMPYDNNRFDRCTSSLFFHHLTLENKEKTFREAYRILKPSGEIHIADWGKPSNLLMRFLFYQVQILDGFKTTNDSVKGILPEIMKIVGFQNVRVVEEIPTMFGTIALYSAIKPKIAK